MSLIFYHSPSNHGKGANRCLHEGCYEDKHTRPIAEATAKYLDSVGTKNFMADDESGVLDGTRTRESNAIGADLHLVYHTNAFRDASTRYLMVMCYRTDGEYRKIFECIKKHLAKVYDGDIILVQRQDLVEINGPKAMTVYFELGFHTNKKDCDEFIHNPEPIGKAIAHGICDYYKIAFEEEPKKEDVKKEEPKKEDVKKEEPKKKVVDEDELWGTETTRFTQKLFGTPQDGVVSNQLNSCKEFLPNMLSTSWEFENIAKGGSAVIKALQDWLKDKGYYTGKVDGYAGELTIVALQKFLASLGFYTGKVDGVAGPKTVASWQRYLNLKLA